MFVRTGVSHARERLAVAVQPGEAKVQLQLSKGAPNMDVSRITFDYYACNDIYVDY